ncbi:cation:proton antiporter domain-containing protein [Streptomyces sp. NPDC055287]
MRTTLDVLSTIGLTLFMFLVGTGFVHTDGSGGKGVRNATVPAVSGIVPSLLLGALVGYALHDRLSRPEISAFEFSFFIGAALSITAFPMLARILYERQLQNSPIGRLVLLGAPSTTPPRGASSPYCRPCTPAAELGKPCGPSR